MHAGRRIATLLLAALLLALPAAAGRVPMEQVAGTGVSLWGQILTHLPAFLAHILPAPTRPAAAQSECSGGMDPNGRCW